MTNGDKKPPFHSFSFTLIENRRPRSSLRLTAGEGDMFELHVQKGSAANPSSQFTRQVPLAVANRLRDALQRIGVFGWEDSYGDATAPGSRRWTLSVVLEEGVFSVESKGGSDAPAGFDDLLAELYRLDFPRPAGPRAAAAPTMPTSIGDLAAYVSEVDLPGLPGIPGMPDLSSSADLANLDQAEIQQRMKDEFRHMTPDEQRQLIDTLVQMGTGSRDFWERFFRS